jgi:hypothetical protein
MANQKPIHEVRLGKVKAAIWRNETDAGPRYSVSIVRLFKVEGGDWESSTSFGRDELPLVSKVADMVHTWIYQQSERKEESPEPSRDSQPPTARRTKRQREETAVR